MDRIFMDEYYEHRYLNVAALPCSLIPTPPDDEPSPDIFHLQEDGFPNFPGWF